MSNSPKNSLKDQQSLAERFANWASVLAEREVWRRRTLQEAFQQDPQRAKTLSAAGPSLWLDFSKTHLSSDTLMQLCQLAEQASLQPAIEALFNGEAVNNTEQRAALHTALRAPDNDSDTSQPVQQTLAAMADFVEQLHSGNWRGYNGEAITDVVNIGIGGSDLGARMVVSALRPYQLPHTRVHFITNIDGADLATTLADLNPATTLFIVASKTFTTLETLTNAHSARQWLTDAGCPDDTVPQHFAAITTNREAAQAFGINMQTVFPMWDWVGGRYSLWSAIGLPIALAVGMDNFRQLLAGAHQMDQHYRHTPFHKNLPVIQALISFWYSQFWGTTSQVVLPYSHLLEHLPLFLQQVDMESLGKSVDRHGQPVDYPTGMVVWGSEGTNGQHSFHQLLHQGTQLIPADFIAVREDNYQRPDHQRALFACCLSQSQALMTGKTQQQARAELVAAGLSKKAATALASHKAIPGNRPSTTLLIDKLTPNSLGELIALYEHKVYTLGVLLNINPFDQWGVELGKQLSKPIAERLAGGGNDEPLDSSTEQLMAWFLQQ